MNRYFVYKVTHDHGGAPCAHGEALSLAICKPVIRRVAQLQDWIYGFGSNELDNRLIYIAEVTEKLEGGRYYKEKKYASRPDCIYQWHGEELRLRKDARFHDEGFLAHDVGIFPNYQRSTVLLSTNFRYFGGASADVEVLRDPAVRKFARDLGRGHRSRHGDRDRRKLDMLREEIWARYPGKSIWGRPSHNESDCEGCGDKPTVVDKRKVVC